MVDALVIMMFIAWVCIVAYRLTRYLQAVEARKWAEKNAEARRPRRSGV